MTGRCHRANTDVRDPAGPSHCATFARVRHRDVARAVKQGVRLTSDDGVHFRPDPIGPLLAPSFAGFDNRAIYRSAFLKDEQGRYRIWYSAASWALCWGIGYLEGPLEALKEVMGVERKKRSLFQKLVEDVWGYARYRGRSLLRSLRTRARRTPSDARHG